MGGCSKDSSQFCTQNQISPPSPVWHLLGVDPRKTPNQLSPLSLSFKMQRALRNIFCGNWTQLWRGVKGNLLLCSPEIEAPFIRKAAVRSPPLMMPREIAIELVIKLSGEGRRQPVCLNEQILGVSPKTENWPNGKRQLLLLLPKMFRDFKESTTPFLVHFCFFHLLQ